MTTMSVSQTVSWTIRKVAKAAHTACCVGMGALMLTSCSTPPKPPSVDESTKRPVNAHAAVELKACEGELSRATILVSELARADVMAAALRNAQSQTLNPPPGAAAEACPMARATEPPAQVPTPVPTRGNVVATVGFDLGSAAWRVQQADAAALVRRAKDAAAIMIRGRTDAAGESLQETALARRRAEAAADFLQQAGVARHKLRLTWQGAGDPVTGLQPGERAQSRRVEIEFYAVLPVLVSLPGGGQSGQAAAVASF